MDRKTFLQFVPTLACIPAFSALKTGEYANPPLAKRRLKLSLNAYSFNSMLTKGEMNLEQLLELTAEIGFDAIDLTGHYFPGYPAVPADEFIFKIKQKAFRLGLDISGTGIRNDFTVADEGKRIKDELLVKEWLAVAAKLGAPVLRVFSGTQEIAPADRAKVEQQVVEHLKHCANEGAKQGVIVAMQNHFDFVKTGEQTISILEKVNHPWFGLVLDIGSYRSGDVYAQIASSTKYAVNWQIKENMYFNNVEKKTNLDAIMKIVINSSYNGYLPIETLGPGDPREKVPEFFRMVKKVLEALNK